MNWDYIAGFFDGEGSVLISEKKCRVAIPQTQRKVLEAIKSFSGVGNIFVIGRRRAHWKDAWVYYVVGQQDTLGFLTNIRSRVIVKKEAVRRGIKKLEELIQKRSLREQILHHRINMSITLRNQGLSWREVGAKIPMDWGYARKLYYRYGKNQNVIILNMSRNNVRIQ